MDGQRSGDSAAGVLYGLAAYGWWGLMPLYFDALRTVPPDEILAQRIVWCCLLLVGVLFVLRKWRGVLTSLRSPRVVWTFCATAVLLSANWLIYIRGVTTGQTVETSLGYFINPLINVLLGMAVFRERLRLGQGVAVLLAAAGVMHLVISAGSLPWIALSLAISFALYGLLRKQTTVEALEGLSIETFLMTPVAAGYLVWLSRRGELSMSRQGPTTDALLLASGVITAIPLLCFGQAARKLRLSTLGLLQFLAPTIQFLLAVWHLGEPVTREKWLSFGLIWAALAVYSVDSWRSLAHARGTVVADCDGGAELEPVSQTGSAE